MNKVNFQPLGYNILLEAPKINEKTKSGIIKSESILKAEKDNHDGFLKVLAVGDEVTSVTIGDEVIADWRTSNSIEIDNKTYWITSISALKGKRINS